MKGQKLGTVTSFKYLGAVVSDDRSKRDPLKDCTHHCSSNKAETNWRDNNIITWIKGEADARPCYLRVCYGPSLCGPTLVWASLQWTEMTSFLRTARGSPGIGGIPEPTTAELTPVTVFIFSQGKKLYLIGDLFTTAYFFALQYSKEKRNDV